MWQQFVSNGGHFKRENPNYRRAYLINAILLVYIATLIIFIPVNWFLADLKFVAQAQLVLLLFMVATLLLFRKYHFTDLAGSIVVLLTALNLVMFFADIRHQYFSFVWLFLFPPVAFFLKGHRDGLLYSLMFCGSVLGYALLGLGEWEPAPFTWQSVFNIGFAAALLIILVVFFEASRVEWVEIIDEKSRALEKMASQDPLTGLLNRRAFFEQAERIGLGSSNPIALVMLDIDNFKAINDSFGHSMGDKVLVHFSETIRKVTGSLDMGARFGGEEFLLLLDNTNTSQAVNRMECLMERIGNATASSELPAYTTSVGITLWKTDTESLDAAIRRADRALYQAKRGGRNRYSLIVDLPAETVTN